MAIAGGASPGMEVWNPADGTVTLVTDELPPGVNVIKLFSSLLMTRPNKLECLHLAKTSHSSLTFAGNTRSLPKKEASERRSNWVDSGFALKL